MLDQSLSLQPSDSLSPVSPLSQLPASLECLNKALLASALATATQEMAPTGSLNQKNQVEALECLYAGARLTYIHGHSRLADRPDHKWPWGAF